MWASQYLNYGLFRHKHLISLFNFRMNRPPMLSSSWWILDKRCSNACALNFHSEFSHTTIFGNSVTDELSVLNSWPNTFTNTFTMCYFCLHKNWAKNAFTVYASEMKWLYKHFCGSEKALKLRRKLKYALCHRIDWASIA